MSAITGLGVDAEQAAYELLHGAMDRASCVHADTVAAIQSLPADLSALPPHLARCLSGLREMVDWNPSGVTPRICDLAPLAASARDMVFAADRIEVIRAFVRQAEAERLLAALKTAIEHEGIEHPETLARGRALLAVIEQAESVTA